MKAEIDSILKRLNPSLEWIESVDEELAGPVPDAMKVDLARDTSVIP